MKHHSLLSTRRVPTTGVLVLAALAALSVAARAWREPVAPVVPDAYAEPAAVRPPETRAAPSSRLPVVRITIRPTGFDPAEVTLPRGRFLLAVDNRSGLDELTFRLDREGAGRLHEVRMTREQLGWRKVLDPPPGVYVLTEAGHPDWVCRVRVAD